MVDDSHHVCSHQTWPSACALSAPELKSMAVRTTPDRGRLVDLAWNERVWTDCAHHFSDDIVEHTSSSVVPLNKKERLSQTKRSCENIPDKQRQTNRCVVHSASHDSTQTCALRRPTGTAAAVTRVPGRAREAMVGRNFDVVLMRRVSKRRGGRIVEPHRFFDMDLKLRQLGE